MKNIRDILIALAALACLAGTPAQAAHQGTSLPVVVVAPILTNTTVSFGQLTPTFRGAVRTSQMDQTIPSYQPTTVYGFGLQSPSGAPCDTWVSWTFVSNTASRPGTDFNVMATNTAEGTSAISPTISSTGSGHITGDYVWNVVCSNNGVSSNTATVTYHTVANTVNIGSTDRMDFGVYSAALLTNAAPRIVLSTGGDWHSQWTILRQGGTFTNTVEMTVADSPRYPYISNFTIGATNNFYNHDMVATGNTDIGIQTATNIFGARLVSGVPITGGTWDNLRYYGSVLMYPSSSNNSGQSLFSAPCTGTPCIFENSSGDFVNGGVGLGDYMHISNVDIGHFSNNCLFVGSGLVGFTIDAFTTCHDGLLSVAAQHTDCFQVGDGATMYNATVNNFWCIQAGATGFPQGPFFGGGQAGSTANPWAGYIDDGTGAHGSCASVQCVLTLTTGGYFTSSGGAQIWSPGNISIAQNVRIAPIGGVRANVSNLTTTTIGSPSSPVSISNVGAYNFQMEGIVNTNASFWGMGDSGESGASFIKHFAYQAQDINPVAATSFTGQVNGVVGSHASGSTVTAAGAGTTNAPGVVEPALYGNLTYSGSPAGAFIGPEFSSTEPAQATATANFSGKTMTVTGACVGRFDYNVANGSKVGGLLISGAGIPESIYIIPQLFLPADGCDGNYTLSATVGTLSGVAVTGRPQQGGGLYPFCSGTPCTGTGTLTASIPMVATPFNNLGGGATAWLAQNHNGVGCVSSLHQGTFFIGEGYATGGVLLCGAPVTNTTTANVITPVAADYLTGVLPYTSLSATTAATWNAMATTALKRAYTCNKMLPKVGGAMDLGGGDWVGPLTATGEVILAGGNVPVPQCGIH